MENRVLELTQEMDFLGSRIRDIKAEIINEMEKELCEHSAPDEKLTVSIEKNPSWNCDCINTYNRIILGVKNAYYKDNNPSTAHGNVISYLQTINNERDFIYFIDTLFAKLCSNF